MSTKISKKKFIEMVRTLIRLEIDEASTSANVPGYMTPFAFSDKSELSGRFINTSRQNFLNSLDISCFSLIDVSKRCSALMKQGGAILTLSYLGSQRVTPNYNIMGLAKASLETNVRYLASSLGEKKIRVNAISAGPIKTLAFIS